MSRNDQAIPSAWAHARLGDYAYTASGGTPPRHLSANFGGGIPWVKSGELRDGVVFETEETITEVGLATSSAKIFPKGALCIALYGATIGKLGLLGMEATTNQAVCAIFLPEGFHPWFIFRLLQYKRPELIELGKGGAQPNISQEIVRNLILPIAPVAEQSRIVEALDDVHSDLDAGVAALERAREKLKLYRAAVLKAAVEGDLTADWRARNPNTETATELLKRILAERRRHWEEDQLRKFSAKGQDPPKNWKAKYNEPVAPDTASLPLLPEGWCWATVEQLGEVRLGRQRAPQHHHGEHMRPYLRVANVFEDRLDFTDVKEMNFTPQEFVIYALRNGDILLNEGQSPELVGRAAVYRDEIPGCCYQKTLLRFRASAAVLVQYALSVFRSYLHGGRFRRSANITTSIAHLAAERFIAIEFPLPPLAEQEVIDETVEDHLSLIDHLEADLELKLASAQALRQSLLRHAFTGQLVPQDPNDEPASELLKQIAAKREAQNVRRERSGNRRGKK